MDDSKKKAAIDALNRIMELELAGVVKYTHYALMVYGYNHRWRLFSWNRPRGSSCLHSTVSKRESGRFILNRCHAGVTCRCVGCITPRTKQCTVRR